MRRFSCGLFLLLPLLQTARAAPDEKKAQLMERMRADAAALTEHSQRLAALADAHDQDRPAPPADERLRLRQRAADLSRALDQNMGEYWTLDDAERLTRGVSVWVYSVPKRT